MQAQLEIIYKNIIKNLINASCNLVTFIADVRGIQTKVVVKATQNQQLQTSATTCQHATNIYMYLYMRNIYVSMQHNNIDMQHNLSRMFT